MHKLLNEGDHSIVTTENGVERLERYAEMNGFSMIDERRREYPGADIQVIVVTAKNLGAEDMTRLNGNVQRLIQKTSGIPDEIPR
jgi:CheY-like chemotaxis protein